MSNLASGNTYNVRFKNPYSSTTQVNRIYVVVDLRTITGNAPTINWLAINSTDTPINLYWSNNAPPTLAKGKIHLLSFYTLATSYLAGKEEASLTAQ